ncbi:MAG: HAD-IIB family hydrolase [Alphaproteobacteria bacterium]
MRPLKEFPAEARRRVAVVLTDIDDTLTHEGRVPATAYGALERLREAGVKVIPVTGRPAGWCDHIARMWPVDGVVGENGAFYFHYHGERRRMVRRYWLNEAERGAGRRRLERLKARILAAVPEAAVAADQPYREADLAIDFAEDVGPLSEVDVDRVVALFESAGACAKVSSIHVNGWFGDFDKLAMTKVMLKEIFRLDLDRRRKACVFVGDSPNDVPMFAYFPHATGVANIARFAGRLAAEPRWVTERPGGHGFAELAEALLAVR